MGAKTGIGAFFGFAAGIGAAYLFHKINKEISDIPGENDSYKDKAGKWFEIKKDNIRQAVGDKQEQIKEIITNAKEALLSEDSSEKRKAIMDKASKQIAAINKEIQEIVSKGSKELSVIANKISNSDMFADFTEFLSSLKGIRGDIVDVDYSFESDFEDDDDEDLSDVGYNHTEENKEGE